MRGISISILLLIVCASKCSASLNILTVLPHTGVSHHYAFEPLFRALLAKGHNLTAITHFALDDPPPNYKMVNLSGSYRIYAGLMTFDRQKDSYLGKYFHLKDVFKYIDLGVRICDVFLKWPAVQPFYNSEEKYDVIITELFNSDCSLGFVERFKVPHVAITSHLMMPWGNDRVGAAENPSFVPIYFAHSGSKMSFFQRVENTVFLYYHKLMYYWEGTRAEDKIIKRHFDDLPSITTMAKNTSLVLLNSHHSLSGVVPRAPNVVEVGGMHIKKPKKLPFDLEEYINDSPHGVVYFSFGSMIKGTSISKEKLTAIQQAFSEIPQRVLWKWENDSMPGIPNNVMVRRWLPQLDILSHSNVKAFITHGGMLSTTEAVHCGVPIISIPLFGDQFANAAAAEESGLGTTLLYDSITKETMLQALRKVLDPKMQQSANRLSAIWRDRPQTPLETAVYWIEHVARHGGDHLRPVSADLPLYQYLLLDVLAFLGLIVFVAIYVTYKILACYFRLFFGSKSKSKTE